MCGERLAVDLHAVTADEVAMRNLMLCVERCHLGVASLVAAPYASALSVIAPDEAKLGVVYPATYRVLLDQSGWRAIIEVDERWRAATYVVEALPGQRVTVRRIAGFVT